MGSRSYDGLSNDPIRCVAIRIRKGGLVLSMERPARHHHILTWLRDNVPHEGPNDPTLNQNHEQGFLDRKGKFVNREKAGKLCGFNRPVLSEDLW